MNHIIMYFFHFVLAATPILMVFGCQEACDPFPHSMSDSALAFSASDTWEGHVGTRAAAKTAFDDGDKIGVYATYGRGNAAQACMDNQEVTYGSGTWTYSPTKYWPSDGQMDFHAYYPYSAFTASGKVDYVLNGKTDVMCASASFDSKPTDGIASLRFKHLLRQLRFKFINEGTSYTSVKKISVTNCHLKATLDINEGTLTYTDEKTNTLTLEGDFAINEEAEATAIGESILCDTDGNTLDITLSLNDGTEKTLTATLPDDSGAGKVCLIVVTFEGEGVVSDNCYVIDPIGEKNVLVKVPVAARINKYWTQYAETPVAEDPIRKGVDWIAEIIWQEGTDQDLITFYNSDRTENKTGRYNGKTEFCIMPNKSGREGNVLIGVRLPDSKEYLWSWHIWITKDKATIFDESRGIIDRNLGALATLSADSSNYRQTYGLYYQYGRKDPFPHPASTLSKVSAIFKNSFTTEGNYKENVVRKADLTIDNAIKMPYAFSTDNGWPKDIKNYKYKENHWYSPNWSGYKLTNYTSYKGKSFFDPSPAGWRVPCDVSFTYIWYDEDPNQYDAVSQVNPTRQKITHGSVCMYRGTFIGAYFEIKGTDKLSAFYPAAGYRNTGTISKQEHIMGNENIYGQHWNSHKAPGYNDNADKMMYFHTMHTNTQQMYGVFTNKGNDPRGRGCNIRCVPVEN